LCRDTIYRVPTDFFMNSIYQALSEIEKDNETAALCTVTKSEGSTPRHVGSKLLVYPDGKFIGTVGGGELENRVIKAAHESMKSGEAQTLSYSMSDPSRGDPGVCGGTVEVFVEPILPQPTLYIFGGGHVSMALAAAAHTAGFHIGVIDDREQFANTDRFPMATEVYTSYEEAFEKIKPNASSYLVIVTRGHRDDMRVLGWAVGTEARYVGMIGSKRKVIEIVKHLEEKDGIEPAQLVRVHAPIGLDIGAISPEEIAVSILAEVLMMRNKGTGKMMKD